MYLLKTVKERRVSSGAFRNCHRDCSAAKNSRKSRKEKLQAKPKRKDVANGYVGSHNKQWQPSQNASGRYASFSSFSSSSSFPTFFSTQRTRHSSFYLAPTLPDLYPLFHYDYLRPSASYTVLVTFLFLPLLLSFSFLCRTCLYFTIDRVLTASRFIGRIYDIISMDVYDILFLHR